MAENVHINSVYKQTKRPRVSVKSENSNSSKIPGRDNNNKLPCNSEEKPISSGDAKLIEDLKQFDLNWHYGPCTGISRLERWERAKKHGLSPPDSIRQMILSHSTDEAFTQNLWHNYPL